jgi:hypothetical protein
MPRKLNPRKKERILEVLRLNFAEPKRWRDIWKIANEKRGDREPHNLSIGSKKTLNLYLSRLEEAGAIVRISKGRKNVKYALPESERKSWKEIKEKYLEHIKQRDDTNIREFQGLINKVYSHDIPKEAVKSVVSVAWVTCIRDVTDGFGLLFNVGANNVDFLARDLLEDLVLNPFLQSAKVIEACINVYPEDTLKALDDLRNVSRKPSG